MKINFLAVVKDIVYHMNNQYCCLDRLAFLQIRWTTPIV